jgi:signal transduction histidine kinase
MAVERMEAPVRAASNFPLIVALEAFDAWFREPSPERRTWLGGALGAFVAAAGATGAWLDLDAPPLPPVRVGFGTMADGASGTGEVSTHELHVDDGRRVVGRLSLDVSAVAAEAAVRAFDLALESAWARASVHQTADRGIAGVLDVDRVLQLIVDRVRELVGARYAALGIVDPTGAIERFMTSGISPEARARIGPPPRGHGLLGLIIREGRTFRIPEIAQHELSYGFPPHHPEMHAFLGVPVTVKGRPIGNLYLTNKAEDAEFTETDQRLVEMFALHAGIAIENARLHDQVQRLAVVEERERIGKDLHDGIIQGIYATALSLEDVPELMEDDPLEAEARIDRAIDALNLTIREIRNFILGLQSELIHGADLLAGLATLAHEFRLNTLTEIEVDLESAEAAAAQLPVGHRVQLLQMAREALSNAGRHARAARVRIQLAADRETLTLSIEDDGVGFEPAGARGSGHLGLMNLRSRAAAMGGSLVIDSAPGAGTRMIVRVPLAEGTVAPGEPVAEATPASTGGSMENRHQ